MIFKQNNHRKWLAMTYIVIFFLLELMIITDNPLILGIDHSLQDAFNIIVSPTNTKIFSAITFLGSPIMDIFYLLIIIGLFYWRDKKDASLWITFVLISGNIISFLVKITVKRQRPLEKIIPASGYSFPSGHVFGTTLVVLTIIFLVIPYLKNQSSKHLLTAVLIIWLIIVAISRVYLRGHFLSDVIGSALLAGTWWECCELLYLRYYDTISNIFKLETPKNK